MKALLTIIMSAFAARAEVTLPAIFADHMVLQRDAPVPVWGTADAGEKVTVRFAGKRGTATADAAGKWKVLLAPLRASDEPRELAVESAGSKLAFQDVLVGEVWLASGQSNMAYPLSSAHNAATEIPKADDLQLRFFQVKMRTAGEPQADLTGEWKISSTKTAASFSAVAYFFARDLRQQLKCPVAVIQAAWGGTPAQTWLSVDALKRDPPLARHLKTWDAAVAKRREFDANPQLGATYAEELASWNKEVRPAFDEAMRAYNAARTGGPKPVPARPEPVNPDPFGMPGPSVRPATPGVVFNAMVAPLVPYAMRGVIWYQGEANASAGIDYRALFPRLIADWRGRWGSEFPFLFVQLPGWEQAVKSGDEPGWPLLREAQLLTLQNVPRTGMAVAIDLGDPRDVHPKGKLDVGRRLALVARKVAYGEKIVASGPLYRGFKIEGGAIRLAFSETGGGLVIGQSPWRAEGVEPFPADKLVGFSIAGADGKWHDAEAVIDRGGVLVSSPQVPQPVAARYGWANFPRCNLYNREGLPASPFRTDDWPPAVPR